jgi:hypothetical protein
MDVYSWEEEPGLGEAQSCSHVQWDISQPTWVLGSLEPQTPGWGAAVMAGWVGAAVALPQLMEVAL